jgi:hypothetical protein
LIGEANDPFSLHLLTRTNTTGAPYTKIRIAGKKRRIHDRNIFENVLRNIIFDGDILAYLSKFTVVEFGTTAALLFHPLGAPVPVTTLFFRAQNTGMGMKKKYSRQGVSSYFFHYGCVGTDYHAIFDERRTGWGRPFSLNLDNTDVASIILCVL